MILAPVPPPKTVLAEAIPKPFMEVSILQYRDTERSETAQYKYVCALIQEAHLKIERDFLDEILDFFVAEKEILDEDMNEILNEDLALARKQLKELASLRITRGIKDFYDYLHFQANRDARIKHAECEKSAMDIKYSTDTKIEDNSRAFKLQKANFDKEVNTAVS